MATIYLTTDNLIEVIALKNAATDAAITNATVTADVQDTQGNVLSGADDISLAHVASGTYRGTLADTVALKEGSKYDIVITADGGAGLLKTWKIRATAQYADEDS